MVKIQVIDVAERHGNLRVNFGNSLTSDMPGGVRALRILGRYVFVRSAFSTPGEVLAHSVNPGQRIPETVSTRLACQAEMDQWANVPIRLEFGKVQARLTNGSTYFRNIAELRRAQRTGQVISYVTIRSNLPFIPKDEETLGRILRAGVHIKRDNVYQMTVAVYLMGDRERVNPWDLFSNFQSTILRTIK